MTIEEYMKIEESKQIKCYCGHTSYCDCSPLEEPKQEENEIIDISDHDGIGNAVDNLNNEPPQETLEEAAERAIKSGLFKDKTLFIAGAKWQAERMYTEEDLRQAYEHGMFSIIETGHGDTFEEWFKKK